MNSPGELRQTPLFAAHRRLGARMIAFGGWEMPVQYSGILDEHRAVRTRAGLFDVSHMGEVEIRGPHALESVQRLITNDASRLRPGGAQYTVMCQPDGGIVDDVVYYRLAGDRFFFCVNASNREKDFDWMREQCPDATVVNRSDEFAQLALQGPRAEVILAPLCSVDIPGLRPFMSVECEIAGMPVLVSRTGYTGEDGFELYLEPDRATGLWDRLLEAGAGEGLVPVGLGARDTLRLERGLLLYGNDIDAGTTPLEAGLAWVVKLDKGDFTGREALSRQKAGGLSRRLVGIEMEDGSIPRHGYPILQDGTLRGAVTSGTKSPMLGRGIALGYVETVAASVGTPLEIEIRGRRHPARVVRLPFYGRREG